MADTKSIRFRKPIEVRFWEKVSPEPNSGCWLWDSNTLWNGYGTLTDMTHKNRSVLAHRFSYELHKGPIPKGLRIDHLCRVRGCVNPAHLEAVTHQENCRRGIAGQVNGARVRAKTHCPKGHPYNGENLYVSPRGTRHCKTCRRDGMRHAAAKKKSQLLPLIGDVDK